MSCGPTSSSLSSSATALSSRSERHRARTTSQLYDLAKDVVALARLWHCLAICRLACLQWSSLVGSLGWVLGYRGSRGDSIQVKGAEEEGYRRSRTGLFVPLESIHACEAGGGRQEIRVSTHFSSSDNSILSQRGAREPSIDANSATMSHP